MNVGIVNLSVPCETIRSRAQDSRLRTRWNDGSVRFGDPFDANNPFQGKVTRLRRIAGGVICCLRGMVYTSSGGLPVPTSVLS